MSPASTLSDTQTANAEVSLSDSGCRRHSIRQGMQKSLYQTPMQRDTLIHCVIECLLHLQESLLHPLSDRVSPASTLSDTQTANAEVSLSDSGCRRHSIRQGMQKSLYQTPMQETLYQTADAVNTLSDRGCRSLSIRQWMQKYLYQTVDAGVSLSDSGCRSISIRQRMQKSLYQTADAVVSLSDSGCRRHSIRQRIQKSLYQTADAEVSL